MNVRSNSQTNKQTRKTCFIVAIHGAQRGNRLLRLDVVVARVGPRTATTPLPRARFSQQYSRPVGRRHRREERCQGDDRRQGKKSPKPHRVLQIQSLRQWSIQICRLYAPLSRPRTQLATNCAKVEATMLAYLSCILCVYYRPGYAICIRGFVFRYFRCKTFVQLQGVLGPWKQRHRSRCTAVGADPGGSGSLAPPPEKLSHPLNVASLGQNVPSATASPPPPGSPTPDPTLDPIPARLPHFQ